MPITDDGYQPRVEDEIQNFLDASLKEEFGDDIDVTAFSAFSAFANSIGALQADLLEEDIRDSYQAGFLETAQGDNLDNVVSILGIDRRAATNATGLVRFSAGQTVDTTYTVPSGQQVQTDSNTPIVFETQNNRNIRSYNLFEDSSEIGDFAGDTGSFSIQSNTVFEGNSAAQTDSSGVIYKTDNRTEIGHEIDSYFYLDGSAEVGFIFGVQDADTYYQYTISDSEIRLSLQTASGATELDAESLSIPTGEWLIGQLHWGPQAITLTVSSLDESGGIDTELSEISGQNEQLDEGGYGFVSVSGTAYIDLVGGRAVRSNVRAVESGPSGNVARNTLTVLPSVPAGIQSATNPQPTGDTSYELNNRQQFTIGDNEETDEELRERARIGGNGAATKQALITNLSAVDNVQSVQIYENDDSQNDDSDGRPPLSFEAVVFGGDEQEIGETIFNTQAFTAQDVAGYAGTQQTVTVEASNGQQFDVVFSRPSEVTVSIDISLVVKDTYSGNDDVTDDIIEYIGGTRIDGSTVIGLNDRENVIIDQLKDRVVADNNAVIGVSSISTTPSITTDSDGLDVIEIGGGEVAQTNEGEITITTVER